MGQEEVVGTRNENEGSRSTRNMHKIDPNHKKEEEVVVVEEEEAVFISVGGGGGGGGGSLCSWCEHK